MEYRKEYNRVKSSFYTRVMIQRRKRIKEIRHDELDELMSTMTLEELRERAFNPPEGRHFATRLECLELVSSDLAFYEISKLWCN